MLNKKRMAICIATLALVSTKAKEIEAQTKINEVTVFTQGAQIFSSSDMSLIKGEHMLVFTDLTTDFDPSSIRVGGTGQLTILSVSSRTNYTKPPEQNEQLTTLQLKLTTLKEEIENLDALSSVYVEEEDLLLKNKQLSGTQSGVDITQLKLAADYYRSRLTEIKTKRLEIYRNINKKKSEQRIVEQQINQISRITGKTTGEIVVKVAVDASTKAHFDITYLVRNASWSPYYDLRMNGVDKPISLEYKAKVIQQTGVEWKNVALTLSSGNPSQNGSLPTMSPWYIDFITRNQPVNTRGARANAEVQYFDESYDMPAEAEEIDYGYAANADKKAIKAPAFVITNHLLNFEYALSVPYTIASGSLAEDVAVRTVEVPAFYEYRANVKLEQTAYLVAKLYDWQDYNLLDGNAKLFAEGTFVGELFLNVENTSDTLLLSLGRDESIIITRERLVDMNGSQFAGTSKKETRYWKTTVRNNKKQAVRLVLTDQIPLSRQKDITVKLEEAEGAKSSDSKGYVVWQLNLAPAETRDVKLGYSVKYPKDQTLNFYD